MVGVVRCGEGPQRGGGVLGTEGSEQSTLIEGEWSAVGVGS